MKLIWTDSAQRDIGELVTYIWFESPAASKRVRVRIERAASHLKSQPFMGKIGVLPNTREAFAPPSYRIVYSVENATVSILRVAQTARQWPPVEDD